MKPAFFSLLLLVALAAFPEQNQWEKVLDKDGIIAYTRHAEGSQFKEFRGEMVVSATIASLLKIINDKENAYRWQYKTEKQILLHTQGNKTVYYYEAKTPGFLKTRVSYQQTILFVDSLSGETTLFIENIPPIEPIPKDCLEIPLTKGFWKLTPMKNGHIKVVLQMLAEPGGMIPAWLANLVVVETPYVTLSGLREMLDDPIYRIRKLTD